MSVPYLSMSYIFPPRPESCLLYGSDSFREIQQTPGWIAEIKANGQRNTMYIDPDGKLHWWSRHARGHKNYYAPDWLSEEVLKVFDVQPGKWTVIDGELLHAKDASIKDTLFLWDVLVLNGEYLLGKTRDERYSKLISITRNFSDSPVHNFIRHITPHVWVAETIQPAQWDEWPKLTEVSWVEGFVLKNTLAKLAPGLRKDNNGTWQIRVRKEQASGHVGKYG